MSVTGDQERLEVRMSMITAGGLGSVLQFQHVGLEYATRFIVCVDRVRPRASGVTSAVSIEGFEAWLREIQREWHKEYSAT